MQNKIYAWLDGERERWVLWLPVGLGLGAGLYFLLPQEPPVWAGPGCVLLWAMALSAGKRFPIRRLVSIIGLVIAIGFAAGSIKTHSLATHMLDRKMNYTEVTGTVTDIIRQERNAKLVLENPTIRHLTPEQTPQRITINARQGVEGVQAGDRLRVTAGLFPPPLPSYPGAYDFRRHFYFEGIGAVGYTVSRKLEILEHTETHDWQQRLSQFRQTLTHRIRVAMTPPHGAVAAALITGDDRAITKEVKDAMRDSGLYHILAVSGMNLALVAGILFFTARFLLVLVPGLAIRVHVKKWAALIAMLGTIFYLLLAGAPVSAQRACVMVGLVLLAVMLDRRVTPMRSLAWAASIILLVEPQAVLAPGFQLSFAATLALIAFYERFKDPFLSWSEAANWWQKIGLYIISVSLSTLVAGLATAPFAIYHFSRFASYSLLANMIVIPIVSFWLMPWAMLALLLMPLGLEQLAFAPMEWGIIFMLGVAEKIAGLPGASWYIPAPSWWGMVILALGALWLCLWEKRRRLLGVPLIVIGMLTVGLARFPDMLISEESSSIAVMDATSQLVLVKGSGRGFLTKQWLEDHGQEKFVKPENAVWDKTRTLLCDVAGCLYQRNGIRIALPKTTSAIIEDCGMAELIVTLAWVESDICKNRPPVISQSALRRGGAHVLWLDEKGWRKQSVTEALSNRPWYEFSSPKKGKGIYSTGEIR